MQARLDEQERQRLLDRYSEIAELAGGLAHEIRNPLSTIAMSLELVVEELDDQSARDRRIRKKIDKVQRECQNLEEVLNDFLKFTQAGELHTAPTDVNELVDEFVGFYGPLARECGVDLSRHLSIDLPRVELDRSLMRQVLQNLAQNAQQAMPEGGLLELQTRLVADRVQLEVIDNGTGIDEATRNRIFQAFFSTRDGGSGLGLPTVRKIVEAHGGTINCESEPGRGTRFILSFPPADA